MTEQQMEMLINTLKVEVQYQKEQLKKAAVNGDDNLYHYLKGQIEANTNVLQILAQTKALNQYNKSK